MKTATCSQCHQELAYDQLLGFQQDILCHPCAEARLKAMNVKKSQQPDVQWLLDPTICTRCKADGGEHEHEQIGGLPYCPGCAAFVRCRPFPVWLKVAAACLLVLAALGIIRSISYLQVRHRLNVAVRTYFEKGDIDGAQVATQAAFKRLPESKEVSSLYYYFSGIQALQQDDNGKAFSCFNSISLQMDENSWALNYLKTKSQINLAFDQKKYGRAAALARGMLNARPDNVLILIQAAAACAAEYAENGDIKIKNEVLGYIAKSRESLAKAPQAEKVQIEYEINRIIHRLDTRQVLNHKEYEAKFGPPPPARAEQEAKHS